MSKQSWDDATIPGAHQASVLPSWLGDKAPPAPPRHVAAKGLTAASNAAADPQATRARSGRAAPAHDVRPLQLVWFDADRISSVPDAPTARRSEEDEWLLEREVRTDEPADRARARLAGAVSSAPDLEELLSRACDSQGFVSRAFAVVEGDLSLRFDRLRKVGLIGEMLEPLGALDKRVADLCRETRDIAARSLVPNETVAVLQRRLLEAHAIHNRPAGDVEALAETALLEARAFERRRVFGNEMTKATLSEGRTITAYLTTELAESLPLLKTCRVRLVVEIVPAQEAGESACAIVVLAAARDLSQVMRP